MKRYVPRTPSGMISAEFETAGNAAGLIEYVRADEAAAALEARDAEIAELLRRCDGYESLLQTRVDNLKSLSQENKP